MNIILKVNHLRINYETFMKNWLSVLEVKMFKHFAPKILQIYAKGRSPDCDHFERKSASLDTILKKKISYMTLGFR